MADRWLWKAHYSDGAEHSEKADDGTVRGFASVDQSRLVALEFVPADGEGPGVCVQLPEDARPILFRRRHVHANIVTEESWPGETITCLGFQKTIKGVNQKAILALYEDGSILLTDDSDGL